MEALQRGKKYKETPKERDVTGHGEPGKAHGGRMM